MKILVLGDVHARSEVFDILDREIDQVDLVIFLGDFVSTHDRVTEEEQIRVCDELWKIKEANPAKVVILRANHDTQAIHGHNVQDIFQKLENGLRKTKIDG